LKKITGILLLLIYTTTAFGLGVDRHFCGGKLVSAKIEGFGTQGGDCTSKGKCSGCCKDESIVSKTDEHQIQGASISLSKAFNDLYESDLPFISFNLIHGNSIQQFDDYEYIPITSSRELLSLIHVLRI